MKRQIVFQAFLAVLVAALGSVVDGQTITPKLGWYRLIQPTRASFGTGFDTLMIRICRNNPLPVGIDSIRFYVVMKAPFFGGGCGTVRASSLTYYSTYLSIDPVSNKFTQKSAGCTEGLFVEGHLETSETMTGMVISCSTSLSCRDTIVFSSLVTDVKNQHADRDLPEGFLLDQNYPNPFNPATTISYHLPQAAHVSLSVYDVLGREAATLVNEVKPPGTYSVQWNAAAAASGVYFYRLQAGSYTETKRLLLLIK
jgi:hypothetical protein